MFSNNFAGSQGGAICFVGGQTTLLEDCVFEGNSSGNGGGCIFLGNGGVSSSPTLVNCIFSGNSSTNFGGGIYYSGSQALLSGCIIRDNSGNGGGINVGTGSQARLLNTIVCGNTNNAGGASQTVGSIADLGGNDILDECPPDTEPCLGDINGDEVVDAGDLGLLIGEWGCIPGPKNTCTADLNEDGIVDSGDLGLLISAWGACNP